MNIKLILLFLLGSTQLKAQQTEFKLHDNGLIYSEVAMGKLKRIVDSLNLKFKTCDGNKKYYSYQQGIAHFIDLEGKKCLSALEDIKKNIPYGEFVKKYPKVKVFEKLVVIASTHKNYENKDELELFSMRLSRQKDTGSNMTFENKSLSEIFHGDWVFNYQGKTKYSKENIQAYFFISPFVSKPIPQKYAHQIQYADCLIDTTVTVFTAESVNSGVRYYNDEPNRVQSFLNYVDKVLNKPIFEDEKFEMLVDVDIIDFDETKKKLTDKEKKKREEQKKTIEKEFEIFQNKISVWEDQKKSRVDSLKQYDPNFMNKLIEAYTEVKISKASNDFFEEYVGLYISKEAELELKRNRRVIGGCSMDNSPRVHAMKIALLSAETTNWEVFLQSHLDIMNDRFDRVSDGSWSQKERRTYIKELEDLNINVLDLVFGISFRAKNNAANHYDGSITRLGRALSESNKKSDFENQALAMIEDTDLDIYNRLLIYFLFCNYNQNLIDEQQQNRNKERLQLALNKLPDYIQDKIDIE